MKINQSDFDLLNALIRGDLNPLAKAELQKRLENEEELNTSYQFMLGAAQGIRNVKLNEKLDHLKTIETNISKSSKSDSKVNVRRIYPLLAIAATILLLATALFLLRDNSIDHQFIDANFNHVPTNLEVTRTDQNSKRGDEHMKAYNLYEVKSYEEAAPLLLALFEIDRDTVSLYYAGLSYLASYNLKKAEACLTNSALNNSDLEIDEYLELIESAKR